MTETTTTPGDAERLKGYVDAWAAAVQETLSLLRSLEPSDWDRPTDLAGWDVRAVAAHLAHLESELAGNEQTPVDVPELEHIRSPLARHTEGGTIARRGWPTEQVIDELEQSAAARLEALRAHPPVDGGGTPDRTPGGIGWDWETLLSNRVVDLWMHDQDIRRAVGRPGDMDSPAAAHTVSVFARAFGYVVGKRVAPAAGTTVVLDVTGLHPVHLALEVNEQGRAIPVLADPDSPTVTLSMPLESYVVLCGGRRDPNEVPVDVVGDTDLGRAVLAALAVTP